MVSLLWQLRLNPITRTRNRILAADESYVAGMTTWNWTNWDCARNRERERERDRERKHKSPNIFHEETAARTTSMDQFMQPSAPIEKQHALLRLYIGYQS